MPDDDSLLASLRYLFADIIGDEDEGPPVLPDACPDHLGPVVTEAIHLLIAYQSTSYAQLYIDRLNRFVGRRGVDDALLGDIARLMAERMAYEDAIRIAQLKLGEAHAAGGLAARSADDVKKLRLDELIDALPEMVADPILAVLDQFGWRRRRVSIRFSANNRFSVRRLRIEAGLKRWRLFSGRYAKERLWVERWLHMIDRSLTKQPGAARAVVQTATMIQGYGDPYRQGIADWHLIIDGLVKPTFDGALALPDLAGAIAEARAAIMPDPRQAALKRKIAEIRARVPVASQVI
ncbi:MAG: hypothetical protein CFE30_25635 [Bradyrhizobium sp. PARBB1]|uniref:DUF6537 domain-containing protein n=1 Tax=Bradyrhizobium TaxID=374 RepID=UPI000395E4B5|nr:MULTISPECIES: DUF6537 domain-containing protein [Bradyrhizobium]ERF80159.1 MAG: isoquinoline 1-oxidoreductase, alpha subunit [Bradyrhizobium sp. DFCI-1]OYU59495.1 MAG: hypothetical protein CFE30_25635 [Bradyrhizobium sp. PARBB1]PSO19910.1 hypothetical protein C7G43_29680 [Bradyrhizobium sp. MOS004]HAQ81469.1 hypothetical protein [Bradyrhizobium sp.]HAR14845.1 hypothetical protein [Bradyrhizobium sp.]